MKKDTLAFLIFILMLIFGTLGFTLCLEEMIKETEEAGVRIGAREQLKSVRKTLIERDLVEYRNNPKTGETTLVWIKDETPVVFDQE